MASASVPLSAVHSVTDGERPPSLAICYPFVIRLDGLCDVLLLILLLVE